MQLRWILATATITASMLAGCGGSPAAVPAPTPAPAAPAPATVAPAAPAAAPAPAPAPAVKEITVKLADYAFEPKSIDVPLGSKLKITVINNGEKRHDFNIGGAYALEGKTLEPGQSQVLELTADKAGTFEIACSLRGHKDRGMVGTFVVQ